MQEDAALRPQKVSTLTRCIEMGPLDGPPMGNGCAACNQLAATTGSAWAAASWAPCAVGMNTGPIPALRRTGFDAKNSELHVEDDRFITQILTLILGR